MIEDYTIGLDVDAIKDYIIENKGVTRDEAEAMDEAESKAVQMKKYSCLHQPH